MRNEPQTRTKGAVERGTEEAQRYVREATGASHGIANALDGWRPLHLVLRIREHSFDRS